MTTINKTATIDDQKLNEFLGRAVNDLAASYFGVMVVLGRKLGLYEALADAGPLDSNELARSAGCAERYVREWLNANVASSYVDYDPITGKYELSPEHAIVLASQESPAYLPLAWETPASMWADEPKLLEAFRTGNGVAWSDHDPRLFDGVASFYGNTYRSALVQQWLPSLPGVVEKLERGAMVADIGCGFGYSTAIMAAAFPNSHFIGIDNHLESIEAARRHAVEEGLTNVEFELGDLSGVPVPTFDLVCFFDALHDMGDPAGVVYRTKQALKPGGVVLLVEPFAGDRLEDNINVVGRLYYSASTAICVAHSLSEEHGTALGAQAGEQQLRRLFEDAGYAGFRRVSQLPFNLILEARA